MTLLFMTLACKGDGSIDVSDSGIETDTDTDTDADTDTDTDADSDTDSDVNLEVTFIIDGEWEGTGIALHIAEFGEEELSLGRTHSGSAVGGASHTMWPDPPEEDELQPIDGYPDVQIAFNLATQHDDTNGDGVPDEGEVYVGTTTALLTWFEGEVPTDFAVMGIVSGWNALDMSEGEGEFPEVIDTNAIPMDAIPHNDSITIGGTADEGYRGRLTLLPAIAFEGGEVEEFLYDEELGATWEIALDGGPPEDHLSEGEGGGGYMAYEVPLAYEDTDHSGGVSEGDGGFAFACDGDNTAALLWIPQSDDPLTAWSSLAYGFGTGWTALSIPPDEAEEPTVMAEEDLGGLSIDGNCTLGE